MHNGVWTRYFTSSCAITVMCECPNIDPCVRFVGSVVEILVKDFLYASTCFVGFFSDLYYQCCWLHCFCPSLYEFLGGIERVCNFWFIIRVSTLCSIETTQYQLSYFKSGHMHRWNCTYLVQLICTPSVVGCMTPRALWALSLRTICSRINLQEHSEVFLVQRWR